MKSEYTKTIDDPGDLEPAASYARQSKDYAMGIKRQHEINTECAREEGFHVLPEYQFEDNRTSGRSTSRIGLNQLMALVQTGNAPFKAVYVFDKSRLSRADDYGWPDYIRIALAQHGVTLRYANSANLDLSKGLTSENVATAITDRVDSLRSNLDLIDIRDRTVRGSRALVIKGFWPGGVPPYGASRWLADMHTRQPLQAVPDYQTIRAPGCRYVLRFNDDYTRQVVVDIFNMVDRDGLSYQQIAKTLNDRGIAPPYHSTRPRTAGDTGFAHPDAWSGRSVRIILSNPAYQGDLVWGRAKSDLLDSSAAASTGHEGIVHRDGVPNPPISREQFERVQEVVRRRREVAAESRGKHPTFMLTGRLFCAACGIRWSGSAGGPARAQRRYYRHGVTPPHLRQDKKSQHVVCSSKTRYIPADDLEDAVVRRALKALSSPAMSQAIRDALLQHQSRAADNKLAQTIADLEAQFARGEGRLDTLTAELSNPENAPSVKANIRKSMNAIAAVNDQIQRQLNEVKSAQLIDHRAGERLAALVKQTDSLTEVFRGASATRQKTILAQLLKSVTIDGDGRAIDVVLNVPLGSAAAGRPSTIRKRKP
ncbi:MAG TPA: recombinase family protein [Longimicrobium sp.]|jgi:DNA invertase Pin-like site-specific DNA recombinase|uniref:recombinase family protein n=1 Tax=Longimicrobium sp. TaxID=2029185 RepID=UPI002EDA964C